MTAGTMQKQHFELVTGIVRPLGYSQTTLLDVAFTDPATYVDTSWWLSVASDPAIVSWGVAEVVVLRLYAAEALPAVITAAYLEAKSEDVWLKHKLGFNQGSFLTLPVRTRSKRTFKRGERLVIVARVQNFGAGGQSVMIDLSTLMIGVFA